MIFDGARPRPPRKSIPIPYIRRTRSSLTISILVKEAEGLLEFGNLLFGQLISHGEEKIVPLVGRVWENLSCWADFWASVEFRVDHLLRKAPRATDEHSSQSRVSLIRHVRGFLAPPTFGMAGVQYVTSSGHNFEASKENEKRQRRKIATTTAKWDVFATAPTRPCDRRKNMPSIQGSWKQA